MMSIHVWLVFLGMSLSLAACAPAGAYSLKDSGASAIRQDNPYWIDNQRVLLGWVKERNVSGQVVKAELVVWDTVHGTIKAAPAFSNKVKLCIRGESISYLQQSIDADSGWVVVYGKVRGDQIVEEQSTPLPKAYAVNPFSCRYYAYPYPWTKGGHTAPLLEEHGYVDLSPPAIDEERSPLLYRPGVPDGIPLPFPKGVGGPMGYAPFRTAYLFVSVSHQDPITGKLKNSAEWPKGKPMSAWWLAPEGTVTQEAIPYHPFMAGPNRAFLPVKGGIFAWANNVGLGTSLGHSGGYLVRDGTTRKVIAGLIHNPVVSPDGCRIAFVHEPQFPTDVTHQDTVKVKMVDLCDGGTHE